LISKIKAYIKTILKIENLYFFKTGNSSTFQIFRNGNELYIVVEYAIISNIITKRISHLSEKFAICMKVSNYNYAEFCFGILYSMFAWAPLKSTIRFSCKQLSILSRHCMSFYFCYAEKKYITNYVTYKTACGRFACEYRKSWLLTKWQQIKHVVNCSSSSLWNCSKRIVVIRLNFIVDTGSRTIFEVACNVGVV
jgi:hypothetical protein